MSGRIKLESAHHASTPKPGPGQHPRVVLIRFHNFRDKQLVLEASQWIWSGEQPHPQVYQGSKVMFFQNSSADITNKHKRFDEMKKRLRLYSLFTKKGNVRITVAPTDLKILSKILVTQLESVLPHIINADKQAFFKGRNCRNNIIRVSNVVQMCLQSAMERLVVSLDAEEAFDRVEWCFFFYTLEQFGLGHYFIDWVILILYNSPYA